MQGHEICNSPCPGDGSQVCGGRGSVSAGGIEGREIAGRVGVTVYQNLLPVGGVGVGGVGNENEMVVRSQGGRTKGSEANWGMGCSVAWLVMPVWAILGG
jgi:hypothetical protein